MLQCSCTAGCGGAATGPEAECISHFMPWSAFHCMTFLKGHEPSAKNTLHHCNEDEHIGFPQSLYVDSLWQL